MIINNRVDGSTWEFLVLHLAPWHRACNFLLHVVHHWLFNCHPPFHFLHSHSKYREKFNFQNGLFLYEMWNCTCLHSFGYQLATNLNVQFALQFCCFWYIACDGTVGLRIPNLASFPFWLSLFVWCRLALSLQGRIYNFHLVPPTLQSQTNSYCIRILFHTTLFPSNFLSLPLTLIQCSVESGGGSESHLHMPNSLFEVIT